MPWKRLISGIEEIFGSPGENPVILDRDNLAQFHALTRRLGLSRMRARDIADGYLALLPGRKRRGKGVYYTPSQVVEYILDEVLPPPRNGKKKADPYPDGFRILEPACGAGYFLLAAFSRMKQAYIKAGYKPHEATRLILSERISGVDIDSKALMVALAGLITEAGDDLATAVEIEPVEIGLYRADFLDKRIEKCPSRLGYLLRSNVQAIVGNPPYISFYSKRANSISKEDREYYKTNYRMGKGRINTYCLFIERAFDLLTPSGMLGFIVPNTVLIMKSYELLRQYLLERGWLKSIVDLSLKVFPEVEVPTCILTVEQKDERALPFPRKLKAGFWESARGKAPLNLEESEQSDFRRLPYTMFNIHIRSADREVLEAIERVGNPLGISFDVRDGINPANMSEKLLLHSFSDPGPPFKRVLRGKDISSYQLSWDNMWVRYDRDFADPDKNEYYFLRDERIFKENPKILTRQTADRLVAAWDDRCHYALNSLHVTIPRNGGMDMRCLLAFYNSKLLNYYYRLVFPDTEKVFPQVKTVNVEKLPLPLMNGEEARLAGLVDKLLSDKNGRGRSNGNLEKTLDEIDEVVYSLYELGPKQIARIENSTKSRACRSQIR